MPLLTRAHAPLLPTLALALAFLPTGCANKRAADAESTPPASNPAERSGDLSAVDTGDTSSRALPGVDTGSREAVSVPVGGSSSRDFTSVISVAPTASYKRMIVVESAPKRGREHRSMIKAEPPWGWENEIPAIVRRSNPIGHGERRSRRSRRAPEPAPGDTVVYTPPPPPPPGPEQLFVLDDSVPQYDPNIQSNLLTAGSFDDSLNPGALQKFARAVSRYDVDSTITGKFVQTPAVIRALDASGRGLAGAEVVIGKQVLRTGTDGRAIYQPGWDDADGQTATGFELHHSGHVRKGKIMPGGRVDVALPLTAAAPHTLDLALVIDATGSMSDELEYLKVELRAISEAVHGSYPNTVQRFAFVMYRDQGDEYVTRRFDFTSSLDDFLRALGSQHATGGGDKPEAAHRALSNTSELLSWSTGNTARVAFWVADAPPHPEHVPATMNEVEALRARGVAIYPVAASGVDPAAEFVMRSSALLTGAEYIFLTDDSGVGNPHAEPHIPCYTVEKLAGVMRRAIQTELTGRRSDPIQADVLRSVGQGQSGVCM